MWDTRQDVNQAQKRRPLGITILAILEAIGGTVSVIVGAGTVALSDAVIKILLEYRPDVAAYPSDVIDLAVGIFAWTLIIVGGLSLVNSYGLWKGRSWAWALSLVLAVLGLLSGILALPEGVVSVVLYALMLFYLTRPRIRSFFRAEAESPPLAVV
jgi:lysylphosphatidylglycerol synthetase-like protein (DUF2156 family)